MAIARQPEFCHRCGKQLRAKHKPPTAGVTFVGDTFIGYYPCDCSQSAQQKDVVIQQIEKIILNWNGRGKTRAIEQAYKIYDLFQPAQHKDNDVAGDENLVVICNMLVIDIPFYAYGDHEAACALADQINHTREFIVHELLNQGTTDERSVASKDQSELQKPENKTSIQEKEQDESKKATNIPDGENDWTTGSETFTRQEVFKILYTQRAMISNDIKIYCTSIPQVVMDIIKNPRKPKI